jgi:RimJ/RimL family protein N-acetyltransferase
VTGHVLAESDGLRLRRAVAGDVDFLAAIRVRDREGLLADVERSLAEPGEFGRILIEVEESGAWRRAGLMGYEVGNRRSRIANLGSLAVHPEFRGRRLADRAARLLQRYLIGQLGYHRLQLEIYGFNERAMQHAERAGFVREGVRRKAYRRGDEWVDGVLYGLVEDDLYG